jgi:hypothetical protein
LSDAEKWRKIDHIMNLEGAAAVETGLAGVLVAAGRPILRPARDSIGVSALSSIIQYIPADSPQTSQSAGRGARDTQTSRAQSSINWRGNGQQQSIDNKPQRPQASTPAASSGEGDSSASQAMAEGRRLYLGNMPYMAKTEDIEALLTDNGYKAYSPPF